MKRSKKFFAVLVCLAMLTSLLAACGGSANKPAESTAAESIATTSSTEAVTTQNPAALLPYSGEAIVYKGFGADLAMKEDPTSPIFQEYQKMLGNITIEWELLPWADYYSKIKLFLSSGDVPDIVWMRDSLTNTRTYGDSGIFLDFEKYKDNMPNFQASAKTVPAINYLLTDKGTRYALPNVMSTDYAAETWLYNKTLLDKLRVAVPTTTDELYTAMKTIKEKDPSVTPFLTIGLGIAGAHYTLYCFANMFGTGNIDVSGCRDMKYDKASQKWSFDPVSDPSYKAYIDFISKCYKEKLLDPAVVTMSDDAAKAKVAQGNWAFTYNYVDNMQADQGIWPLRQGKNPPIDVETMLTPAYNGTSNFYVTTIRDGAPCWGYFASAKVKNPEILASVLDLCYSQKLIDLYNWGVEGVTYNTVNSNKIYTDDVVSGKMDLSTKRFLLGRFVTMSPPLYSLEYQLVGWPTAKKGVSFLLNALKDGKMQPIYTYASPIISSEDADKYSKIMTPIKTYAQESELKFLTGKLTVAEWDKYLEGLKKIGNVDDALAIYNSGKNFDLGDRLFTQPEEVYGVDN